MTTTVCRAESLAFASLLARFVFLFSAGQTIKELVLLYRFSRMAMAELVARANAQDMGKAAPALLNVWIYFNLIPNTIFLPILVATFIFSKQVRRHPTLVNLCLTWIFSGIFSLLLFYAGEHKGPEPGKALCTAQTALLYGITPMWSVAIFMMVYHMTVAFDDNPANAYVRTFKLVLMLSAPYIAQFSFSLAALIIALEYPGMVNRHRRFFYCSVKLPALGNAMTLFTFIVCVGILMLELQLAARLYKNWRGIRKAGRSSGVDVQLILRVLAFGIYVFFGMVANVISQFSERSLAPDMYAATFGTVVLLVFGTQPDVLRAWCFWRYNSKLNPIYLFRDQSWRSSIDLEKSASVEEGEQPSVLVQPPVARVPSR